MLTTGPVQVWVNRVKTPYSLLAASGENVVKTHHFQDGRQSEGDVDLSGDAVIDNWTEVLLFKHSLEGNRVYPMLVKTRAVDGKSVCPSCREQRP